MRDCLIQLLIGPVSSRIIIAVAAAAGTALLTYHPDAFSAFCQEAQNGSP